MGRRKKQVEVEVNSEDIFAEEHKVVDAIEKSVAKALELKDSIVLSKDFVTSISHILSTVEKDSSPDCDLVFFIIKDEKLSILRKNRYSEILINYEGTGVGCKDITTPILFEDFVKISKAIADDVQIQFLDNKLEISGEDYKYSIQNFKFMLPSMIVNNLELKESSLVLKNDIIKDIFNRLVVSPLDRTPACLDSIYFDGSIAYCVDHVLMCKKDITPAACKVQLPPIPLFLFNVSQKLSDDCTVLFYPNEKNIAASFNIGDMGHVVCLSSFLNGQYPIELIKNIFDKEANSDLIGKFNVEADEFVAGFRKVKAISGKKNSVVELFTDGNCLNVNLCFSEKSADIKIPITISGVSIPKFRLMCDILSSKIFDGTLHISVTKKFFIIESEVGCCEYILPLSQ